MKIPNECQEYQRPGVFGKLHAKNSGISRPGTERSAYNRLSFKEHVIAPEPSQYCQNSAVCTNHTQIKKTHILCPVCGSMPKNLSGCAGCIYKQKDPICPTQWEDS